jgi:hypothetical protein
MRGMKGWGLFLFGAGCGTAAGAMAGQPALVPGVVVGVLGLCLLAVGARRGGGNLVEDATTVRGRSSTSTAGGGVRKNDRPTLSGLGTRVEQILQLAEQQAAALVEEAEAEAARIVARARTEAARFDPQ